MINTNCILNLPYPTAAVMEKNPTLAEELMQLYAGRDGELTCFAQYSYQHIILKKSCPRISDVFECLAITEMKHLHLLGELICLLGADPRLGTVERSRQLYWNGAYVYYGTKPDRIIHDNIRSEKKSVIAYHAFAASCRDHCVKAVINRIITDEEHHITVLEELYKNL